MEQVGTVRKSCLKKQDSNVVGVQTPVPRVEIHTHSLSSAL